MGALKFIEIKLLLNVLIACLPIEHLFGHQYAVEMLLPVGQWWTGWLKRFPNIAVALNEVTGLNREKTSSCVKREDCHLQTLYKVFKTCGLEKKEAPPSYQCNIFVSVW